MKDIFLLKLAKNQSKKIWLGKNVSCNKELFTTVTCLSLNTNNNFRSNPKFHNQYEQVWLFEKSLDQYHKNSWKIIIDESIRLLDTNGYLIVNIVQNQYLTIPMLKTHIERMLNISSEIAYANKNILVFKIHRLNIENYRNKLWTFAILTLGSRDEAVIKFLESIRKIDPDFQHEIIISGPKKAIYDTYQVRYLNQSNFRNAKYAEIAKKKNAIAQMASNANLLIAHDRYYLNEHFFSDFEKFGYDFDFVAIKQEFENGKHYPYYCYLFEPIYSYSKPVSCLDTNYIYDTQYVNGGLIIFKTASLNKIKFCNSLFWNEMEDVEITNQFMKNSLVPRVNNINTMLVYDDGDPRLKIVDQFSISVAGFTINKEEHTHKSCAAFEIGTSIAKSENKATWKDKIKKTLIHFNLKAYKIKKIPYYKIEKLKVIAFDLSILEMDYLSSANKILLLERYFTVLRTLVNKNNSKIYFFSSQKNKSGKAFFFENKLNKLGHKFVLDKKFLLFKTKNYLSIDFEKSKIIIGKK